ncbi:cytochrome P450 [Penicillium malachiteum]|nr:cytochrome P450 [Penicillium malachiteum]
MGNALYRSKLDDQGRPVGGVEVLMRGLHKAIGVSIYRVTGSIYLTDLEGAVYKCDRNGQRKKVFFQEERRAFTGYPPVFIQLYTYVLYSRDLFRIMGVAELATQHRSGMRSVYSSHLAS